MQLLPDWYNLRVLCLARKSGDSLAGLEPETGEVELSFNKDNLLGLPDTFLGINFR